MASTHKSLRSSTANKRPTTSIADGQIALNTNAASPGLFFKDSTGADIIKVGPVHVGTTAPNATPASGGSTGNSTGEVWLDTSLTPVGVKIWDGSAWQNATPAGSTTVKGLLELATNTETQTGTATALAVTPAGLQSKMSDSVATTSSTTIASSTAVKSAYDVAAAALPATGGTMSGQLLINSTGSLVFEGATENEFETTLAVADPTADRTVTIPNQSGNFLISGNASIVNADVNASAAIAGTKISPNFGSQTVQTTGVISHALGTAGAPTITFTGDTNTGIYSPGADQLAISSGGTQRMHITSDGQVGIGTASPAQLLHVSDTSSTAVRGLRVENSEGSADFFANGGGARIDCDTVTDALVLDSTGRILSVPTYDNTTASTTNYLRIGANGLFYRSTSSIAYKTDVEDMEDVYADAILNLRPVWYRSTCEGDNPNHSRWGFIAEEVEQVDPRLCSFKDVEVTKDEAGNNVVTPLDTPVVDGVDYAALTPLLLNLIKRQKTQIEALEARLSDLEASAN